MLLSFGVAVNKYQPGKETNLMGTEKSQSSSNQSHAWVPAGVTELIDDLLWAYACAIEADSSLQGDGALSVMMREHIGDIEFYSDGSPIGGEYLPDHQGNVIGWESYKPPHRRCACEARNADAARQFSEAQQTRRDHAPSNDGAAANPEPVW